MHKGGVYIHIPFCRRKCPYCDFHSIVTGDIPHRAYVDALLREWEARLPEYAPVEYWESIYIGGGTPSLLDPAQLARLVRTIGAALGADPEALEITVEANPNSLTQQGLDTWRSAGVNRVSLGVQALNDKALGWLGRLHDRQEALTALNMLKNSGMGYSADMLFGWPEDSAERMERELGELLTWEPEHISLYELTVYEDTPLFGRKQKGEAVQVDDDRRAELLSFGWRLLETAGFEHYEISNFCRPGRASRHNDLYWSGGSYMGLGASAHGYIYDTARRSGRRYGNMTDVSGYMKAAGQGDTAAFGESSGALELLEERLMLAMRRAAGLDLAELAAYAGVARPQLRTWLQEPVDSLVRQGLLQHRDDRIAPTTAGMMLADTLAVELCAGLPESI